ncbi:hypothetical protein [Jannaschia sp. 2305UL9-9]|uniref:hypothetical protein n=1 Tax=Jannaschia sp. 2305UL9-9 TaxID=3121638 RepID=UPI0035295626
MTVSAFLNIGGLTGDRTVTDGDGNLIDVFALSDFEYGIQTSVVPTDDGLGLSAGYAPFEFRIDTDSVGPLASLQARLTDETSLDATLFLTTAAPAGQVIIREIALTDSRIVDYVNPPGNLQFTVAPARIGIESTPLRPDGTLDTKQAVTIDATAEAGFTDINGNQQFATGLGSGGGRFILSIEDRDGPLQVELPGTSVPVDGFAVSDLTLSLANAEGPGNLPLLSPLMVDLETDSSGTAAAFFANVEDGKSLGGMKIVELTGASEAQIGRTIDLTGELVTTAVSMTEGGSLRAAFDYGRVDTRTIISPEDGSDETQIDFGATTQTEPRGDQTAVLISEAFPDIDVTDRPDQTERAVFLKIEGIDGDAPSDFVGESGWFDATGFDFAMYDLAGGIAISELIVDLPDLDGHGSDLLGLLTSGADIASVTLKAFDQGLAEADAAETVTLTGATIKGYSFGTTTQNRLVFGFDDINVTSSKPSDDGKTAETTSFDTNATDTDFQQVDAAWQSDLRDATSEIAGQIFLDLDGVTGDSASKVFKGQIDVEAVQYHADVVQLSDDGPDVVDLSAITLDLEAGERGITELRSLVGTGEFKDTGKIVITQDGTNETVIQTIDLSTVNVTDVTDRSDGGVRVLLNFRDVEIKQAVIGTDGKLDTGSTVAIDRTATPDDTDLAFLNPAEGGGGPLTGQAATGRALEMTGTLDALGKAEIDILGYDLDMSKDFDVSIVPPRGSTLPSVSPLTIDLAPGDVRNLTFLSALTTGDTLGEAVFTDIQQTDGTGAPTQTVEYELQDVAVLGYTEGLNDVTRVSLGYSTLKMTEFTPNSSGDLVETTATTFSNPASSNLIPFNLEGPSSPRPTDLSEDLNISAFLKLPGLEGSSVVSGFEGFVTVDDYDIDMADLGSRPASDGSPQVLRSITLQIGAGEHFVDLLTESAFEGEQFPTANLTLARASAGGPLQTFQTFDLSNVSILSHETSLSGGTQLELGFSLLSLEMVAVDPRTGQPVEEEFVIDVGTDDVTRGTDADDDIDGGRGNDLLSGEAGDDTLRGGEGDDSLNAASGAGDDLYDGGSGDRDVITFRSSSLGVAVDLLAGTATGPEIGTDTITGVEDVVGGSGSDTITGDDGANILDGGAGGPDTLIGLGGNDTLIAGSGGDLDGGEGVDTYRIAGSALGTQDFNVSLNQTDTFGHALSGIENIEAGSGNDFIGGDGASNRLDGGGGNDTIFGGFGAAADTVIGGDGDDLFQIEGANVVGDVIVGGTGFDRLQMFGSGDAIYDFRDDDVTGVEGAFVQHGTEGTVTIGFAQSQIEGLSALSIAGDIGTTVVDVIVGMDTGALDLSGIAYNGFAAATSAGLTVTGRAGDDLIRGGDVDAVLIGLDGADTLTGGALSDRLIGGTGDDVLIGGAGEDVAVIAAAFGDVTVATTAGGIIVTSADGADTIDESIETLEFTDGIRSFAETAAITPLTPTDGPDELIGTDGPDRIDGLGGDDTIIGDQGDDTLIGSDGDDSLLGVFDDDSLLGGAGIDTLRGNVGNDTLIGGADGDLMAGDAGDDLYIIGAADGSRIRDGIDGRLGPDAAIDIVAEDSDGGADTVRFDGLTSANLSVFYDETTQAIGWADGTTLTSATFIQHSLTGIDLWDRVERIELSDGTFMTEATGLTVSGSSRGTLLLGTRADDVLTGLGGADEMRGGAGDDTLIAGRNDDTIFGGAGDDTLFIDALLAEMTIVDFGGSFSLIGPDGNDLVEGVEVFRFTDATITADALIGRTLIGTEAGDTLAGEAGADTIEGRGGDDVLTGAFGDDVLSGEAGNDRIDGGLGGDVIRGGDGNDTLIGGGGDDRIIGGDSDADLRDLVFGGDGNDTIDGGAGNDELRGDAGDDSVGGGFGADTVIGGTGDDTLTSGAFGDVIFGGDGIDFINGGFGSDRLNGGEGADRFFHLGIFDHGSDFIQDYSAADGDILIFGGAATAADFQINAANTTNAGADDVDEAFVIYRPTGQIIWALVDGMDEDSITLRVGGVEADLLT